MIWVRRVLFLAIGVVITLVAFRFWSNFAMLMGRLSAAPPPSATAPTNPGEVTMKIIPATPAQKPKCDKQHPCPK